MSTFTPSRTHTDRQTETYNKAIPHPLKQDTMRRPTKTPTSSLSGRSTAYFSLLRLTVITAITLLINFIWFRIPAFIRWVYSGGPFLKTSSIPSSPVTRLPFELVEIIIAYLIYDTCSLRACTQTCYSWYIAAVPHLHHTLICPTYAPSKGKYMWLLPLAKKSDLGLLPLVEALWVDGDRAPLSPWRLFHVLLVPLSPSISISKLRIDYLDIPRFLSWILWYSMQFLPTLRDLTLKEPKGSRREIIYFVGLFQHLQDLKLLYDRTGREEPGGDPTLIPPFVPPLRGLLTMRCSTGVELLRDMIDLFGGLRFRHMNLFQVDGTRLLLDACAKTLESVVLDPSDSRGEQLSLMGTQI